MSHLQNVRVPFVRRYVLAGVLAAAAVATPQAQPAVAHRDITYIMPIFGTAMTQDAVDDFKLRIGEGPYVRLGFSVYISINMTSWTVDTGDPAAVRAALTGTFADIDAAIALAQSRNLPVHLSLVNATRSNYDAVQAASEQEDRRSMQWYMDDTHAPGWWSYSRYARKARIVEEAYIREVGRYIAKKMAEFPETLVSAAGDGEVEMSYEKSAIVDSHYDANTSLLADYSPFAMAEFRDWLKNEGLYMDITHAGEAYSLASRYHGDLTPGTDDGGDGHTLNQDFGTSFASWNLRIGEWELSDLVSPDPHALPGSMAVPAPLAGGFDAPRLRVAGDPWWELFSTFRQAMVTHHNKDFSRWITTTMDPVSNTSVPADRWYSYQIPTDYIAGGTPAAPNYRFVTAASPLTSADVSPYGGMGITSFNTNLGDQTAVPPVDGPYVKTLATAGPAIEAMHRRWAILEWNPSVPKSSNPQVYRDEMGYIERYRPGLLVPFMWVDLTVGEQYGVTRGTPFETELKSLVQRIGNVPGGCSFAIPATASTGSSAGSSSFNVAVTAAAPLSESECPWTATSDSAWLHVDVANATGAGDGPVGYSVDANSGAPRSGTITVAGFSITVTQAGACSYALSASGASAPSGGAAASAGVVTAPWCDWTAASNDAFITVTSGASGTGNGAVGYSVAANPAGLIRTGTLTVAGQTFTVTQAAATCTYVLGASAASSPSAGGTGSVNLTTPAGCAWTAVSNTSFITVTSGASGSGSGSAGYSVGLNPGTTQRTGTLTIGGKPFTITQAASATCTYTLGAASASAGAAASTGTVSVTTGSTCPRTSSSSASFLTITSGGSGPGNGTVAYSVAANSGLNFRAATLTIAGRAFFVTQAGRRAVRGDFTGDGRAERSVYNPRSGVWSIEGLADRQWGLPGDIPVPGDYNGDRSNDAAVYRPATAQWFIQGQGVIQWGATGDLPVPGDYNGDGATDAAIYRTTGGTTGVWFVRGQYTMTLGVRGDIPVPADYDGDGRADPAVYRPSTGTWFIATSTSGLATVISQQWGLPGDIPVAGDFDGDGRADLCVYRPASATWFGFLSSGVISTATFGAPGDVPLALDLTGDGADEFVLFRPSDGTWLSHNRVTATTTTLVLGGTGDLPAAQRPRVPSIEIHDFDGDGRADITVFRPDSGMWFTRLSTSGFAAVSQQQWGLPGDLPVPGDYDGDRRTDLAVFRPETGMWFLRFSSAGFTTSRAEQWGLTGDVPVPADYDGDGRTDLAIFRPDSGLWYVRLSSTDYALSTVDQFGLPGDLPVPGDYDADGKADLAVYRPALGMWFVKFSASGATTIVQWGLPGDTPVAVDFDGDGRTDLAVFRPESGLWFVKDPLTDTTLAVQQWGLPGDAPCALDYDGDGILDFAVFRPDSSMWFLRLSAGGSFAVQWGLPGDMPLARIPEGPPQ